MSTQSVFALFICILSIFSFSGSSTAAERVKRELRFPRGTSFVTAVALASLLPKGPTDGFAHVLEFDLNFPFPEKIAIDKMQAEKKFWKNSYITESEKKGKKKLKVNKYRGRRSMKDDQKQSLLLKIEDAIKRVGFDGHSCVSRFQCELQKISLSDSLLEELLFTLFRTDDIDEKYCAQFLHSCPFSLLHALMHSEQISPMYM